MEALLEANGLRDARLRLTLTRGNIKETEAEGSPATTMFITAGALTNYPEEYYRRGMTVIISAYKQSPADPLAGHKSINYFGRLRALQEAQRKQAGEALWFTTDNRLAEACFCNVFLVLGGKVHTPPRDTPVLPGIVRQAVGEICRAEEIPYDDETLLTVHEMLAAEEMFLTASCSGIRPVVRVERHAVGDETPGRVTKRIMSAYEELLRAECGR